ncbi:dipicolinate synthase subunit DpsA [Niallia nealsonii]|uniref:Dipicolinic acid synthetase subunit A n=1 Tax=Niallia nealsonii TaxID=115979 RepID=A0A2N0Z0X3_9BACI|nr:dipicolinate synthase subunit DpsA [Niallia nealsonii]PKG23164.1 dipicolinic acid synthetase subunit A [Niallia nealsonii]
MKKNLLIMGGDKRQADVIKQLAALNITLYLASLEELNFNHKNIKHVKPNQIEFPLMDGILLPIPGIHDGGKIETAFSSETIILTKEMIAKTKKECVIYSGVITPYLQEIQRAANRKMIAIFERDDVAILNSIPTAEGALMLAIENTPFTIHQANVLVLGFGRVGKTVARLFHSVGARVSVCIRKQEDVARVIEMGMAPVWIQNLPEAAENQAIFINTMPYFVINASILDHINKDALIIDLASKPGGTDFAYAKKLGIKTLWSLGLPAKVAPKTAGEIIGNVLTELFIENL